MIDFTNIAFLPLALASLVAGTAAVFDLRTGRIPNWLTFPAMMIGWLLNLYLAGLSGLGYSLAATLLGILLYLPGGAFRLIGMGDVKLLGALGAIGGSNYVFSIFLYASALGIPHAILIAWLNYGKDALMMLYTSFSTGAVLQKTIHQENAAQSGNKKYRFLMGIDIFLGTLIGWFHLLNLTW